MVGQSAMRECLMDDRVPEILAIGRKRMNPQMTFVYISGSRTDSSEEGRSMWARVKGKTENDLLKLPFKDAYMFRPGVILPQTQNRKQ